MKIGSVEKKSVDKLVEQCSENSDGNEVIIIIIYNTTSNKNRPSSSAVCIVLFRVAS